MFGLQTLIHCTAISSWTNIGVKRNPTSHKTTYLVDCIHVFQINDNNEFYAGALSIDKHSSPLQLVSIILKVDNFQ